MDLVSEKEASGDEVWRHREIRLRPDATDPGFQAILLREIPGHEIRVIAEPVEVFGTNVVYLPGDDPPAYTASTGVRGLCQSLQQHAGADLVFQPEVHPPALGRTLPPSRVPTASGPPP